MPIVVLDSNNPPQMSAEELARLDALTDAEITAAAERDPDNPPLTEEEFAKIKTIQLLRGARSRTGLSQTQFAARYRIDVARLRDWERPFRARLGRARLPSGDRSGARGGGPGAERCLTASG